MPDNWQHCVVRQKNIKMGTMLVRLDWTFLPYKWVPYTCGCGRLVQRLNMNIIIHK